MEAENSGNGSRTYTKELVQLLRRNPELLRDDDVQKVINPFEN